jgi:ParB-like nuclease domain
VDAATKGLNLNLFVIPLAKIHPNGWNPNQQDARTFKALEESLEEFKDFDPITVRIHPTLEDEFEIVDGEHRYRARLAKGYKYAVANVLDLTDDAARKLTIVTLEDRGHADKLKLARLLEELDENGVNLETRLPYDSGDLEELLKLASTDWEGEYDKKKRLGKKDAPTDSSEWVTFTVRMTHEDHVAFLNAHKLIAESESLSERTDSANGQVIHALAAEYLGFRRITLTK